MAKMTEMDGECHGMSMEFHFGHKETVLFGPWTFDSVTGLLISMVAIAIMAFAYECLKTFRDHYSSKISSNTSDRPSMWSFYHFTQTLFHGVQVILANLIMLIFMTYNVWLCLAVVAGAVFGYFVFGLKRKSSSANECGCH